MNAIKQAVTIFCIIFIVVFSCWLLITWGNSVTEQEHAQYIQDCQTVAELTPDQCMSLYRMGQ